MSLQMIKSPLKATSTRPLSRDALEASLSLDAFGPQPKLWPGSPRPARVSYDWGMDRPGAAFHIEPISDTIPADLDPNLSPAMVPLQIRLAASRPARLELMKASLLGIAVTAGLIGLCAATITAATIRMPEVIQASVDAEGV